MQELEVAEAGHVQDQQRLGELERDQVALQRQLLEHAQLVHRMQSQSLALRRDLEASQGREAQATAQLAAAQAVAAGLRGRVAEVEAEAAAAASARARHGDRQDAVSAAVLIDAREEARELFTKLLGSQERESELRARVAVAEDAKRQLEARLAEAEGGTSVTVRSRCLFVNMLQSSTVSRGSPCTCMHWFQDVNGM